MILYIHIPMKLSLIIPVYNEATYLLTLFSSVKSSTMQPDEIILCDNGSTDGSLEIAQQAAKTLPIKIIHEKQKGITYAVDRAWRAATGDIVLKVDADTKLEKVWIARAAKHFADDPLLAACTGPIPGWDGNVIHKIMIYLSSTFGAILLTQFRGYPLLLGSNSVFRKSALVAIDGYQNAGHDLDDQFISKKLHDKGFKTAWFWDMANYHSTRRYSGDSLSYIRAFLSLFHPKFYKEKEN
jgi:glycosyltransferase involved in cell wall biosynthesis